MTCSFYIDLRKQVSVWRLLFGVCAGVSQAWTPRHCRTSPRPRCVTGELGLARVSYVKLIPVTLTGPTRFLNWKHNQQGILKLNRGFNLMFLFFVFLPRSTSSTCRTETVLRRLRFVSQRKHHTALGLSNFISLPVVAQREDESTT